MRKGSPLEQNLRSRNVVGDILRKSAARHPDKRVLRFRDRNYTYRELNETVNRCAHGLMKLGIQKGDRAAILAHNSDHFVIYWWALLKIGAIQKPERQGSEERPAKKILCIISGGARDGQISRTA